MVFACDMNDCSHLSFFGDDLLEDIDDASENY